MKRSFLPAKLPLAALRALGALFFVTFGGCLSSAGGPEYAELELAETNATTGRDGERYCLTLPVLPGAHAKRDFEFEGGFVVHADQRRDELELTFSGVQNVSQDRLELSADRLRNGYENALSVTTPDGDDFILTLTSPCPRAAADE